MATAADVKTAYRAINRTDLNDLVAQSVADAINSNSTTLDDYIAGQISGVASTTQAAVAISAFVTGLVPTSDKLDALAADAANQVASYTKMGVGNPALGAYEAFGKGFALTTEFATKYGSLTGADFITSVYVDVYGHVPSDAALASLMGQLTYFNNLYATINPPLEQASEQAKGAVLGQIVGYAFVSDASASSSLDDRVVAALTAAAKGDASVYSAPLAPYANPGQTFVLTTNTDSGPEFTGGLGNDIFKAPVRNEGGSLTSTLNPLDVIDGGAGVNTLEIEVTGGRNALTGTILNIQNVSFLGNGNVNNNGAIDGSLFSGEIRLQQTSDTFVMASNLTGQTLIMDRVADGTKFRGEYAATQTSAKLQSLAPVGDARFTLNGAALTDASLSIDGTKTGDVVRIDDGKGTDTLKNVNIDASGKSTVGISSDALENVKVTGAGAVTLIGSDASKSIDASGSTGGVTVVNQLANGALFTGGEGKDTITLGATTKAHTMGAGDDTVNVTVTAFDVGGSVDGGDGVDTLAMSAADAAIASNSTAFAATISNFEILSVGSVEANTIRTVDMANLDNLPTVKSAGTAAVVNPQAEVNTYAFSAADADGGNITFAGINIKIDSNASATQVAEAVAAQKDAIIAAHPDVVDVTASNGVVTVTHNQYAPDEADFVTTQGKSAVTFDSTATPTPGTTEKPETQTLTVGTGPSTNGVASVNVNGTNVAVALAAGQTVAQAATAIQQAIAAAGIANVTATVSGAVVTLQFAAAAGDAAEVTFTPGATNAAATPATPQPYVAASPETQTFKITHAADADGGSVLINGVRVEVPANASIDDVGAAIKNAEAAIKLGTISGIASIDYNTVNSTVTVVYTQAAGDVGLITAVDNSNSGVTVSHTEVTPGDGGTPGGSLVLNNFVSGGTFELTGTNDGSTIINVKDAVTNAADTLNIHLNGVSNLPSTGMLVVDSVETLAITTSHTGTAAVTAASALMLSANAATAITLSGDHGVDFSGSVLAKVASLDASGVTGTGAAGAVTFATSSANLDVSIKGGAGDDWLSGASTTDATKVVTIDGGAGNDHIVGGAGKDVLSGGEGKDTITGGLGADTLSGGAGNDKFVYNNIAESTLVNRDVITDFQANTFGNAAGGAAGTGAGANEATWTGDVIEFHVGGAQLAAGVKVSVQANAADAQTFIQNTAAAHLDQVGIALDSSTGYLYIDADSNGTIDSVIQLTGVTAITAAAFHLF